MGNPYSLVRFWRYINWYLLTYLLISELRSVTCHVGWHSISCHPTQL